MAYKARTFLTGYGTATETVFGNVTNSTITLYSHERMHTYSSGYRFRDLLGKRDVGNPWVKDGWLVSSRLKFLDHSASPNHRFVGIQSSIGNINGESQQYMWPTLPQGGIDPTAAGTLAISRCAPTVPHAEAAVGIAELVREGMPMVGASQFLRPAYTGLSNLRKARRAVKDTSSEYLNYQFGLKPLMNDLRKLSKAIYESDEIIQALQRNSGKIVRRSYTFPDVLHAPFSAPFYRDDIGMTYPSVYLASNQLARLTYTSSIRTWFDGAFTYYFDLKGLNAFDRVSSLATRARHLYGIKLTPDVLWNLMPWSWLVDWKTNIGDIITNISLFQNDGLVMLYGYLMQCSTATNDFAMSANYYGTSGTQTLRLGHSLERHKKTRMKASPWGFGLDESSFTPRQVAILAALGLSRGR